MAQQTGAAMQQETTQQYKGNKLLIHSNNMDEFQNHYAKCRKANKKTEDTVWFHLPELQKMAEL